MLLTIVLPLVMAAGDARPPQFSYLPSTFNNSALSMTCRGEPPFTVLECDFTQAVLMVPSDAEVQKKREEAKTNPPPHKQVEDFKKSMCPAINGEPKQPGDTPAQREATRLQLALFRDACRCKNDRCFTDAMLKMGEQDDRTCHIFADTFHKTLRSAGPSRWVSSGEPSGLCQVVEVATLEHKPGDPDYIGWTFTMVTASGDTSDKLCKWVNADLNKPRTYSWRANREFAPNCKLFKMGY
jgi:hypothetical protein